MDILVDAFARAYNGYDGYQLAETLSPATHLASSDYLTAVWKSAIDKDVKSSLNYWISSNAYSAKPGPEEAKGWVEVYAAFIRALGEILAVQNPASTGKSVRNTRHLSSQSPDKNPAQLTFVPFYSYLVSGVCSTH